MPERRDRNQLLTLTEVATAAKNVALVSGGHHPTAIIEGEGGTLAIQIDPLAPTFEGRAQQFFLIGHAIAQTGEVGVLQQTFFISEGWMSSSQEGKPPTIPPSQDPQRQEVLIVSHLNVQTAHAGMVMYEMRRNRKGRLIGMSESVAPSEGIEVSSPLLEALAQGFLGLAGKLDD